MDLILWAIALLLLGLSMLILEIFVPSGGVLSFLAVASIIASIVVAFMDSFQSGTIMLVTVTLFVPVFIWGAVRLWPHTPIGKLILAKRPAHPDDVLPETEAYRGLHALIGKRGRAMSKMLPSGLVMIAGHILLVGSYGGWSYGFRYLVPIVPLLLFYVPVSLERLPRLAFGATLVVSIAFAAIGAYHPWPPGFEQEKNSDPVASVVTNPVGGNLAAWLREHFPDSGLTTLALDTFISGHGPTRTRYLELFYSSKGVDPEAILGRR